MAIVAVLFRWARYAAWILLGAGFLVLVAGGMWGPPWGAIAVALLVAGYCVGVFAVLPIIGQTFYAAFAVVAGLARRLDRK